MSNQGSLLRKSFNSEAEFTKEEIFDILFYIKQIIGILLGVAIAFAGIMGLSGLIAFAIASSLLTYLYVVKFLGVDEEVVPTRDILKEHFMNAFFPFLLVWTLIYNFINFS